MPERTPSALALALTYLRSKRGWSKTRLADALGMGDRSLLSRYERGDQLNRERLDALIAPLGYPPEAVEVLRLADRLLSLGEPEPKAGLTAEQCRKIGVAAMAAGWTAAELVFEDLVRRAKAEQAEAERREAEEAWASLKRASREDRLALVAGFPEFRSPALAARVCAASLRAAPHDAREALELAELALSIAGQVGAGEGLRSRAQGFCWGHVGNARRVANDFDGADEAFTRAWGLWRAGADSTAELFPEWQLLSLEASLRRAQRRLPEALELLDRAQAACGSGALATARILLNKETVLDLLGDVEGALAVLAEAAPFVEAAGDLHLLFSLRFNMVVDLCHLERYAEAAALLPQLRELAIEQANDLDLLRLDWLTARIAAGQGGKDAAIERLEQVCHHFTARELPYDAALASLDLAVLWLEAGRTGEVKRLAMALAWIFRAKKIHREALAALRLFCKAAHQESATVELARKVIAQIEKARRSAPPAERPR